MRSGVSTTEGPASLLPSPSQDVSCWQNCFAPWIPPRLLLLEFVLHQERTVSECVQHVGLSQSRVSTHLACLADCGFVTVRRDGRSTR